MEGREILQKEKGKKSFFLLQSEASEHPMALWHHPRSSPVCLYLHLGWIITPHCWMTAGAANEAPPDSHRGCVCVCGEVWWWRGVVCQVSGVRVSRGGEWGRG